MWSWKESKNLDIWGGTPCTLTGAGMGMNFMTSESSTTSWQISANEHFPQTGDRQDAEGTHPGPKHPDRAETCH